MNFTTLALILVACMSVYQSFIIRSMTKKQKKMIERNIELSKELHKRRIEETINRIKGGE